MKHFLMVAAALCCIMSSSVILTSCGDDDKEEIKENKKPYAVEMTYTLSTTEDMLKYFDITVDYYNAAGRIQNEQVTNTEWKKTVSHKLPATLGARATVKLKEGVDVKSINRVSLKTDRKSYAYKTVTETGTMVEYQNFNTPSTMTIKGEDIEDWISKHNGELSNYLLDFDKEGNTTSATWPVDIF